MHDEVVSIRVIEHVQRRLDEVEDIEKNEKSTERAEKKMTESNLMRFSRDNSGLNVEHSSRSRVCR